MQQCTRTSCEGRRRVTIVLYSEERCAENKTLLNVKKSLLPKVISHWLEKVGQKSLDRI